MALLTSEERKRLAASDFALPEERKYPIQDENHARDALARVAADGTDEEKAKVLAAVHKRYPKIGASEESPTVAASGDGHDYSCVHCELPDEISDKIKSVGRSIPDDELADGGREDSPHITVKYGLNGSSSTPVKDAVKGEMPARFRMGRLGVFPADENRKSDVLVARVHSPDLHRLNEAVSGSSSHVDTYPTYEPHATVAYLKPGMGAKYAGREDVNGMEGLADSLVHSSKDGRVTKIPLTARSRKLENAAPLSLSADAIILDASGLAPAVATGLPEYEEIPTDEEIGTKSDGSPIFKTKRVPVQYFKKEIAYRCDLTHRGEMHPVTGAPLKITLSSDDLNSTVDNFNSLKAAGVKPFIPDFHIEGGPSDASVNNGEVIDVKREGDSLYANMKLVGEKAIEKIKKNDVSVYLINADKQNVFDSTGKRYQGRVLRHLTLTPNPALPHLKGFARIAASADGDVVSVPIYRMNKPSNAAARPKGFIMSPEVSQRVRKTLALSADITEDALADFVAERAIALSGDVTKLTTERDDAKADAAKKNDLYIQLSADAPKHPDSITLAMYLENINAKREHLIGTGAISEAQAKRVDSLLLGADGSPTVLALSATGSGAARKPLAFHLWSLIGDLFASADGLKLRNGTERDPNFRVVSQENQVDPNAPLTAARYLELGMEVPAGVK